MAFTPTVAGSDNQGVEGDLRYVRGSYVNDGGSTGGEIKSGLQSVHEIRITALGAAAQTLTPTVDNSVDPTFPTASGDVTIITDADSSGVFTIVGR